MLFADAEGLGRVITYLFLFMAGIGGVVSLAGFLHRMLGLKENHWSSGLFYVVYWCCVVAITWTLLSILASPSMPDSSPPGR